MNPARDGAPADYKRPTINDVAALSGVSKSTVSNVMRGTGSVSGRTRARVIEAVERLGYRPNATARNLVMQRTNLIGVVVGDVANAFDAELLKGIEQHGSERGYTTLVCSTDGHPERESARIAALLEQRVDGIAMLDFSGDRAVLAQLLAERVPVVMVSCWSEFTDCVAVDEYAGVDLAVHHLAGLGHRRIAHATDPLMEATTRRERLQAFERAMLRSGLSPRADWTLPFDAGGAGILALFDGDEPPTAVVAANDHTAIPIMELLERRGLEVPRHVSIVGFDGIAAAGLSRIALTTVAQPRDELVREAMKLLFARIETGRDAPPEQERMQPELVVRGSTAPPPA